MKAAPRPSITTSAMLDRMFDMFPSSDVVAAGSMPCVVQRPA